jgi:hypothetical protein
MPIHMLRNPVIGNQEGYRDFISWHATRDGIILGKRRLLIRFHFIFQLVFYID